MRVHIQGTEGLRRVNFDEVVDLYVSAGWGQCSDYDVIEVERMFNNTSFVRFAFKSDGELIGLARALTDEVSITWLAEVVVAPLHREQGVGRALVAEVLQTHSSTAIYTEAFVGTEGFFVKCGIKPKPKLVACSRAPAREVDHDSAS